MCLVIRFLYKSDNFIVVLNLLLINHVIRQTRNLMEVFYDKEWRLSRVYKALKTLQVGEIVSQEQVREGKHSKSGEKKKHFFHTWG